MQYLITAFDNHEGLRLNPIQETLDTFERDPAAVRKEAVRLLARAAARIGGNLSTVHGMQFWDMGGVTWYPKTDEPIFCGELTKDEVLSDI